VTCSAVQAGSYFNGVTRFLAVTAELVGGQLVVNLYINGALAQTGTQICAWTAFPTMRSLSLGSASDEKGLTPGTYSNAMVYDRPLTDDEIASIYEAGATAYAGDTVPERIARICNWVDVEGDLVLDDSDTVCTRHMPDERSLLDALWQVADTDGGILYIDAEGNIRFVSRLTKQNSAAPSLTVDASDIDPGVDVTEDDDLLANDITINRVDIGAGQRLVDEVSVRQNGRYTKSVDTLLTTDQEALAAGGYLRAFYAQPLSRCRQISLECLVLNNWPAVLGIVLWQILRITNMPTPSAPTATMDLFVEGFDLAITIDGWVLTIDTSFAIPFAILNNAARDIVGSVVVAW
jgi:hypothetical protein